MSYKKIIVSGSCFELFEYEGSPLPCFHRRKKKFQRRIQDVKTREFRPDNLYRKKRAFVRIVRANLDGQSSPAMFSFTTASSSSLTGTTDIKKAYLYFRQFVQRLHRSVGKTFQYVVVLEFQERGAIHFHALFWGLDKFSILNERNSRFYQHLWQRGFVDCVQTDGSIKLAGYLGKYFTKAMLDQRLLGAKAYSTSRGIKRPAVFTTAAPFNYSQEVWGIDLKKDLPIKEYSYDTKWLGRGHYKLFDLDQVEGNLVQKPLSTDLALT